MLRQYELFPLALSLFSLDAMTSLVLSFCFLHSFLLNFPEQSFSARLPYVILSVQGSHHFANGITIRDGVVSVAPTFPITGKRWDNAASENRNTLATGSHTFLQENEMLYLGRHIASGGKKYSGCIRFSGVRRVKG